MKFTNLYYDHFSKRLNAIPPKFNQEENFMMRFKTQLPYYAYEENSLTIIYFRDGSGHLIMKDQKIPVNGNTFIVSNPGAGWEYYNKPKNYIDVLSFALSNDLLSSFNFFCTASEDQLLDIPFEKEANESFFIEKMYNADCYDSGQFLKLIYNLSVSDLYEFIDAKEITFEVVQNLYKDQLKGYQLASKIQSTKNSTKVEALKRLLTAYEYIQDNIDHKISLEELSKASGLSEYHLFSSFKKVFGTTPHQYINKLKMVRAKSYIKQDLLSISEIADQLNFPDLPSFSKLFKKTFGQSPSHFSK